MNLKNIRNKDFAKLCKNREIDKTTDDTSFRTARDFFDSYQKQLYENYVRKLSENYKTDVKKFWTHINNKRKSNSLPYKLKFNGATATNDKEKADMFANFFKPVYTNHEPDNNLDDFLNKRLESNCFNLFI